MSIITIDDIKVGESYTEEILFDEEKISSFIAFSKDTAGIHTKESFSKKKGFENRVVHGFLLSINFSRILGMELPGENTVIASVNLEFHEPVYVGDLIKYSVAVTRILYQLGGVLLDLKIQKSDGTICVKGKAACFFKKDKEDKILKMEAI